MILSHIVAASENGVIGRKGQLPWHISADLKAFKARTKGHIVIMGRKTFESLGRPLPDRLNIVITQRKDYQPDGEVLISSDLTAALAEASRHTVQYGDEVFIIGGGQVYRQTLHQVDRIYLTRVHLEIDGDTFYPHPDAKEFDLVDQSDFEGSPSYSFLTFVRRP